MKDGGGTLCAKRLSFLMDTLIEARLNSPPPKPIR